MKNDIEKILFTEEQLKTRIKELGQEISRDHANSGRDLVLICVLKGSVPFMADIMRAIDLPCTIDFMAVSSYGRGTVSTGEIKIKKDIETDLIGKDVLIIEDILDSGLTLSYIMGLMGKYSPASIKLCTLLDKPERRKVPISPNYCGFTVPDEFVVGFGLDYNEKYRNLPYIGVLKRSVYEN